MNCDGMNEWLSEGAPKDGRVEAVRTHVAACSACQELLEFIAAPLPLPEAALPRAPGWAQVAAEVGGTAAVAIGLVWAWWSGPGWAGLGAEQRMALVSYAGLSFGLLTRALSQLRRPAGIQPVPLGWLLAGAAAGYPLFAGAVLSLRPAAMIEENGLACLSIGLSVAWGTGGLLWLLARRGFRGERVWLGALIGAAGGLIGMLTLQVVCADQHALHTISWHGLTGMLSVAGGAVAGWLAWRRRAC
jgi:hypothetical protein